MSSTKWTEVNFGKFAGRHMTLPQIVLTDPDWFWYMVEKVAFEGALAREAADIAEKARKIRAAGKSPKRWKARYYLTLEGSFERFEMFDAERDWHTGSARVMVCDFIDLSIPRGLKCYDKSGGRRLIKCLKFYVFCGTNIRLTKRRCEQFFDTSRNFG